MQLLIDMKRNICIIFLFLCGIAWGQDNNKFIINGSVPGIKDGLEVGLYDNNNEKVVNAKAKTIDGKFVLTGSVTSPVLCFLVIDMSPKESNIFKKDRRGSMIYLDNSVIAYSCVSVDSLPNIYGNSRNIKVYGSPLHALYQEYTGALAPLQKEYSALDERYLQQYHNPAAEGIFHTREGLAIVRKMNEIKNQMQEVREAFLKTHGNSVIGIQAAIEMLAYGGNSFTQAEIDNVLNYIHPSLRDQGVYKELQEVAESLYPVAKGEKYIDIPLTDVNGKAVRLADFVKTGEYTMLEFWASWCGPCRGEIPHLKHVHQVYGDTFRLISISIDEREKDWKKALKEENMNWLQLNDRKGMKGPVTTQYKVYGVPYSLILDKDGRIVAGGVRGSELDDVLIQLLGDKFEK